MHASPRVWWGPPIWENDTTWRVGCEEVGTMGEKSGVAQGRVRCIWLGLFSMNVCMLRVYVYMCVCVNGHAFPLRFTLLCPFACGVIIKELLPQLARGFISFHSVFLCPLLRPVCGKFSKWHLIRNGSCHQPNKTKFFVQKMVVAIFFSIESCFCTKEKCQMLTSVSELVKCLD